MTQARKTQARTPPNAPARYFDGIGQALHKAGIGAPVLVIDGDRLDANLQIFKKQIPPKLAYRIVAKSLPSAALLSHVAKSCRTDRLMSFNTIMLRQMLELFPAGNHLLGKPVTLAAIKSFYDQLPRRLHRAAQNIHWLVDTTERLQSLARYARQSRRRLHICLEIDIGLHRGGFAEDLTAPLNILAASPDLQLTALMGYEPHLVKLPTINQWRQKARRDSQKIYRELCHQIDGIMGAGTSEGLIRNIGGSGTFQFYKDTSLANEIAAGSVLVKPSDFDLPLLSAFKPACFIATPILKTLQNIRMPAHELATDMLGAPASGQTLFTHGGYWMADPVYPARLGYHDLYGRSSNQEMMTYSGRKKLAPDDFVFLRPRQSEAIFLQFPDWAIYRRGKIDALWHPLSPSV